MKNFSSHFTLTAILFFLLSGLVACNKDSEKLLETIPSTANFVADVDLPEVLKGLGAEVNNEELIIPDSMKFISAVFGENAKEIINNFYQAFHTNHFTFFQDSITGNSVITMLVRDNKAVDKLFENMKVEKKNGYKVCVNSDGVTLLLKKNQFWALKSDNAVEEIDNILSSAKESNMAQMTGLVDFLQREECASIVSNIDGFGTDGQWACMDLVVKNNKVVINGQLMETDGKVVELEGLQPLQTDFLRYLPGDMNFVAAIGATRTTDWSLLNKIMSTAEDAQLAGFYDTIVPYLHSADGTVAIATTIDTDDVMNTGANFFMMMHMPRHKIVDGLNEIENRMISAGAKPVRDADGNLSLAGSGMSLYAGEIDGYLAIATMPLTPTRNNEFAPYFVNRNAGVYINLPSLPMLEGSPGVLVDLQVQTSSASMIMSCPQGITTLMNFLFAMAL